MRENNPMWDVALGRRQSDYKNLASGKQCEKSHFLSQLLNRRLKYLTQIECGSMTSQAPYTRLLKSHTIERSATVGSNSSKYNRY